MSIASTAAAQHAARISKTLATLGCAGLCLLGSVAEARNTTITGSHGHSASRQVTRQQGSVSSSTQFANGKSSSRNVSRTASGSSAVMTGPNGQTASRSTSFSDSGSTTTLTGANGQTTSIVTTR